MQRVALLVWETRYKRSHSAGEVLRFDAFRRGIGIVGASIIEVNGLESEQKLCNKKLSSKTVFHRCVGKGGEFDGKENRFIVGNNPLRFNANLCRVR